MRAVRFSSRSFRVPVIALGFVLASSLATKPADAQDSSTPASAATPAVVASSDHVSAVPNGITTRVEYAAYVGEGYAGRRSFTTGTTDIRGKNWKQFAERLKAQSFPDYPLAEPAFFNWLAERGWELVDCEQREETVGLLGEKDRVTRCYFRRLVGTTPEPAPADSVRGATSSTRTSN